MKDAFLEKYEDEARQRLSVKLAIILEIMAIVFMGLLILMILIAAVA